MEYVCTNSYTYKLGFEACNKRTTADRQCDKCWRYFLFWIAWQFWLFTTHQALPNGDNHGGIQSNTHSGWSLAFMGARAEPSKKLRTHFRGIKFLLQFSLFQSLHTSFLVQNISQFLRQNSINEVGDFWTENSVSPQCELLSKIYQNVFCISFFLRTYVLQCKKSYRFPFSCSFCSL